MTSKPILFIDSVDLFQILVIVMDFYSLVISFIRKHLFAFTIDPFISYFEPGNTSKNKLKNLKIVFGRGGRGVLSTWTARQNFSVIQFKGYWQVCNISNNIISKNSLPRSN